MSLTGSLLILLGSYALLHTCAHSFSFILLYEPHRSQGNTSPFFKEFYYLHACIPYKLIIIVDLNLVCNLLGYFRKVYWYKVIPEIKLRTAPVFNQPTNILF